MVETICFDYFLYLNNFRMSVDSFAELHLFDINRKAVFQEAFQIEKGMFTTHLDISHLPNGIYYVVLQSSQDLLTKEVVIAR